MKNSITVGLIITSIALLLALQAFWLQGAYEKAYYVFRRETNTIFRNTVFQLRDSVFVNTLQSYTDTVPFIHHENGKRTLQFTNKRSSLKADSLLIRRQAATVQVYISSSDVSDSLIKSLEPITHRIQSFNSNKQSFTIRIAPDSLNTDSLKVYFQKNLSRASINIPATIKKTTSTDFPFPSLSASSGGEFRWRTEHHEQFRPASIFLDTLEIESVRLNPNQRYSASLAGIQKILLLEIAPQVFFSIFLTLIIVFAFIVMYRNIRSQQKLMALKNDFIGNITHELKTPVATVSVALEALQNFDMSSDHKRSQEYLAMAQSELSRLSIMTDKILKTTVFEENGIEIENESVDLEEIISNAAMSLKLLLNKSGVILERERFGESFLISGSPVHLTNMISNLIENSIKYSAEKSSIKISLHKEAGRVILSVKDNGIGIAKEYQEKVFDKFFRVPTGNVHTIKGYGLGLSYVKNVVKAHKATIELRSEKNKGSEFIITFLALRK